MERILSDKNIEPSKIHTFLSIYARYLFYEKKSDKEDIIKELHAFMISSYPNYRPADWAVKLETCTKQADKYPLCKCKGIWVTERELQTIDDLNDKVLERLAFTLLCLAKFGNFRNPDNHNWVTYRNSEIYSMACINATAFEQDMKFHKLKELGLIEYAKKVNNLNIQVLYTDSDSSETLFISDFRKLGYEWRLYKGEVYIRCTDCKILVKNTNGKRKYCKSCGENHNKQKSLQRYHRGKTGNF
ncbi:hypothetical protein AALB16_15895 [Lachnospiraceae bacterium 62-35]